MTGYSTDFMQHPRYQRMLQRMARMQPHQKAILSTLELDRAFADDATRRGLRAARQQAESDYRSKSLDLRRRRMETGAELEREEFEYGKDQSTMAQGIGLANLVASSHFGRKREDQDLEIMKRILGYTNRNFGG